MATPAAYWSDDNAIDFDHASHGSEVEGRARQGIQKVVAQGPTTNQLIRLFKTLKNLSYFFDNFQNLFITFQNLKDYGKEKSSELLYSRNGSQ